VVVCAKAGTASVSNAASPITVDFIEASFLIVDEGTRPAASVKKSNAPTKPTFLKLFPYS
jgi:hypothetical protein